MPLMLFSTWKTMTMSKQPLLHCCPRRMWLPPRLLILCCRLSTPTILQRLRCRDLAATILPSVVRPMRSSGASHVCPGPFGTAICAGVTPSASPNQCATDPLLNGDPPPLAPSIPNYCASVADANQWQWPRGHWIGPIGWQVRSFTGGNIPRFL